MFFSLELWSFYVMIRANLMLMTVPTTELLCIAFRFARYFLLTFAFMIWLYIEYTTLWLNSHWTFFQFWLMFHLPCLRSSKFTNYALFYLMGPWEPFIRPWTWKHGPCWRMGKNSLDKKGAEKEMSWRRG